MNGYLSYSDRIALEMMIKAITRGGVIIGAPPVSCNKVIQFSRHKVSEKNSS
jgi:hypothetical protein